MLPLLAGLAGLALLGNPFRKAAKRRNPKKCRTLMADFTKEDVASYKWSMLPGGDLLYYVRLKDGRSLNMNEMSWEALQAGGATKRRRRNPPRKEVRALLSTAQSYRAMRVRPWYPEHSAEARRVALEAFKARGRNPPRDPRFAGSFKGDVPKGPVAGVHPLIDGDTAAVEGPRGWESWIFGPEIGPRGYREVWQFAAKHPSERAAVEHAKEMVWGPSKSNPAKRR